MPKASLHALLLAAHIIEVEGYEAQAISTGRGDQLNAVRLECDDDNIWWLPDQEVELNDLGQCRALDENGDEVSIELHMRRPMTLADLGNT